ncbi:MAG: thiol-disulfide oxidoreductase DCC family protein [Pyrinomonadaceae bacterium]
MERIVLFDGVCNFCNGAVNFIIRHDHQKKFRFAALQSEKGIGLRTKHGIAEDVDSIILIENDHAYLYSDAALKITRALGGVWSLLYAFMVLPTPVRDWLYKLFAKYRYRLFGKKDVCMVPTPDIKERFLSEPPASAGGQFD